MSELGRAFETTSFGFDAASVMLLSSYIEFDVRDSKCSPIGIDGSAISSEKVYCVLILNGGS